MIQGKKASFRRPFLAGDHLHLPHKAAGVEEMRRSLLAGDHLHLPHEAAGVGKRCAGLFSRRPPSSAGRAGRGRRGKKRKTFARIPI
jgi:hypothetical protein